MAKGFVVDETQTPASTSTTTSPTATASSSTVPTAPTIVDSTSTDVALPRNIAFDAPLLLPSENADKKQSSDEIEHPHQQEISIDVPSAPPITELVSYNDFSITLSERSEIIAALRNAKLAICHSKSKDTEKKKLAAALEEIYSITTIATSRMSQKQADEISDEIRKIMSARSKILEKKKQCIHASNQSKSIDCLDILAGVLMVLRIIADILCIIFITLAYKRNTSSLALLLIPFSGFLLSFYLCMNFVNNSYQKFRTRSHIGRHETFICIIWTLLYGILATFVLISLSPVIIAICGYVSMITCVLQGCCKCEFSDKSKRINRSNSTTHDDIITMEAGKDINLLCHGEKIEQNQQNSPSNQDNDLESRVTAVENLKLRIQSSLTEILGRNYMYHERPALVTEINADRTYHPENNATNTNITPKYTYTYTERVPNSGVQNAAILTQNANTTENCADCWFWTCYFHNSNPTYSHGSGGCCVSCCNDDEGCCEGDGGCCEGDGGCCEDDGGCCEGDGGCCEGDGGCCEGDGGDCDCNC